MSLLLACPICFGAADSDQVRAAASSHCS